MSLAVKSLSFTVLLLLYAAFLLTYLKESYPSLARLTAFWRIWSMCDELPDLIIPDWRFNHLNGNSDHRNYSMF